MKISLLLRTFFISAALLCSLHLHENSGDTYSPGQYHLERGLNHVNKETNLVVYNGTFLGNSGRNYYGDRAPDELGLIWKISLGKGETWISKTEGMKVWAGAGWTGQPLIVGYKGKNYLIIGAYDHKLKKIDIEDASVVWEYPFDDVIKGTGCIWINKRSLNEETRYIVLQGSRIGNSNSLSDKVIPSYRAISFLTGREVWKMNVKKTDSYSRDVDGTALILADTAYIGLENGIFTIFDPNHAESRMSEGLMQPRIIREARLYNDQDIQRHSRNLVTESSPCLLNNNIYISAGSGHVYGYNLKTGQLDWDFYTGSDMDGSPVATTDGCILVTLEKQYIQGPGGVLKLDPSKPPSEAVVWFFPTSAGKMGKWEGGVVGSTAVNDSYCGSHDLKIAAFCGIDGWLYVVQHDKISGKAGIGFDGKTTYPLPRLLFKYKTGPSISTPLIVGDKLIMAGYHGVWLFGFNSYLEFRLLDFWNAGCEATPVVHDGRIYIASRDGNLYCLGKPRSDKK